MYFIVSVNMALVAYISKETLGNLDYSLPKVISLISFGLFVLGATLGLIYLYVAQNV